MTLVVLETPVDQAKSDVRKTLTEALDQNFEGVLVLGFKKGEITMRLSQVQDVVKIIGAIEALKHQLLTEW